MAQSLPAPIALRPRRLRVWMVPALVVVAALGCGHRRSTMRPAYLTPARPCPSGDCGTGAVSPAGPSATTVEPSGIDTDPASTLPGVSVPSLPRSSSPATGAPSITGPAAPAVSDEPDLQPAGTGDSSTVPTPRGSSNNGNRPAPGSLRGSSSPGASLKDDKGRRAATGRVRQASLGEQVKPYLDDPEDLFLPPKADRPWKYIVLHHSASETGGYASIDREHRARLGWQGCGYHFIIGNGTESADGRIEIARRWSEQKLGVHCRDGKSPDVNEYGIGICLVGDLEKSPPTDRQVAAARALVAYLNDRYRISPGRADTHAHLAATPTSCPGRMFPASAILNPAGLARR